LQFLTCCKLTAPAAAASNGVLDMAAIKDIIGLANSSEGVSIQSIQNAIHYIEQFQQTVSTAAALKAHGIGKDSDGEDMIGVHDVIPTLKVQKIHGIPNTKSFIPTRTTSTIQDLIIAGFQSGNRAVACVGPKGCYKSVIAAQTAKSLSTSMELFSLHPDMTARDLVMVRGTDTSGNTSWRDTPLTRAARKGTLVILDGIDKLRSDTLTSLALLLEQGCVILPDGTRFYADSNFRCIALAHPPTDSTWITPEVRSMFHWIQVAPLPGEELRDVISELYPELDKKILDKLLLLQKELDHVSVDSAAEKEALQLTMRKLKHICKRVERSPHELGRIINNTLMTKFLPEWDQGIVKKCLTKCKIDTSDFNGDVSYDKQLATKLLRNCKREASNPLLVPNPRFEENEGQARSELDILEAHSVGEKALLITGYQGVGKNKIVDNLLSKLNCEREYIQLHRDSTIQSLMVTPSVENGKIVYHDSPLVRAAKFGRILVLDEADKAPVEVVALLKGLIEDGQLSLLDGRKLCHDKSSPDNISIHPDFRIWTLTNPAGYPFHGKEPLKSK
jgi:MoxR-like ATPase